MIRCAACGEWTKEPSLCRGAQGIAGGAAGPGGLCVGRAFATKSDGCPVRFGWITGYGINPSGELVFRCRWAHRDGEQLIHPSNVHSVLTDWGVRHPLDPDDLNRCLLLLEAVPEIRDHMSKVAALSDTWAKLVERWEEVEQCFLDEVGLNWIKGKRASRTYELMKAIGC